jgi:hypothetical protein
MMKNKRKEKSDAAHSQRELEKQLREIEQVDNKAVYFAHFICHTH